MEGDNLAADTQSQDVEARLIQMVRDAGQTMAEAGRNVPITLDTDLRRDLGFDSLMLVVLQVNIEDGFHIRFDPMAEDFLSAFSTIRALSACVKNYIETDDEG